MLFTKGGWKDNVKETERPPFCLLVIRYYLLAIEDILLPRMLLLIRHEVFLELKLIATTESTLILKLTTI